MAEFGTKSMFEDNYEEDDELADEELMDAVLELLDEGVTNTKEIMSILDISPQLMAVIVRELEEEGIINVPTIH